MEKHFRLPEDVAPDLEMSKTEIRRYIRQSGICTRLAKGKIVLHADDVTALVAWVREHNRPTPEQLEVDPFAA